MGDNDDNDNNGPVTCCCAVCGSLRVQYAAWYSPNEGTCSGELFGSWNAGDNTFCADCDMEGRDPNPPLVDKDCDPKDFKAARKRRERIERAAARSA
jgi:hypothetical protein